MTHEEYQKISNLTDKIKRNRDSLAALAKYHTFLCDQHADFIALGNFGAAAVVMGLILQNNQQHAQLNGEIMADLSELTALHRSIADADNNS